MDQSDIIYTKRQESLKWMKNPGIECFILQDLLSNLILDIKDLRGIISRFLELHDIPEKNNISGICQGLKHWKKMAEEFLSLDVNNSQIKNQIVQIYHDYIYSKQFRGNQDLIKSPYDSVQAMMKAAIHVGWYKIFIVEKGRSPKFLSGPITNMQQKFDNDIRRANRFFKLYQKKAAEKAGIHNLSDCASLLF
uniref:Uncharacterized protein n=1 Tax=Pithovirus LCPAC202 TaxID=2506592 RepID=A0A481Z6N3_9VIRU|nr:MAG: hypothetical protein LCPAC202_00360 [Pithovirus LCPAC202]